MQLQSDCIPCILAMTVKCLRNLDLPEITVKKLLTDVLTIPGLTGDNWQRTSPDIIEEIMALVYTALDNNDPFRDIKDRLNSQMTRIIPHARELIETASDPVHAAAALAIQGNAIDFMMPGGTEAIKQTLLKKASEPLNNQAYSTFVSQLAKSRHLVYFTDNCGEIVLDKLFISILKQKYTMDVWVVVRSTPTLNDATKKDALAIGMNDVAHVIENGIDGPLPGTVLNRCTKKVQTLVEQSDLIISKGGGNFDSLEEQLEKIRTNITFMFLSKCYPICNHFGTRYHQGIVANYYHP